MLMSAMNEKIFFDLLVDIGKLISDTAKKLDDLINDFLNAENRLPVIEELENTCDATVHKLLLEVSKAFFTPIDREDISLIAKELDNVTDYIEAVAHGLIMFNIDTITQETKEFMLLITKCTVEIYDIMKMLDGKKNYNQINKKIIEINRLENEGDILFRNTIKNLFSSKLPSLEIIKWKEIYKLLEKVLDSCENVANAIEGVIMKYV